MARVNPGEVAKLKNQYPMQRKRVYDAIAAHLPLEVMTEMTEIGTRADPQSADYLIDVSRRRDGQKMTIRVRPDGYARWESDFKLDLDDEAKARLILFLQ